MSRREGNARAEELLGRFDPFEPPTARMRRRLDLASSLFHRPPCALPRRAHHWGWTAQPYRNVRGDSTRPTPRAGAQEARKRVLKTLLTHEAKRWAA